MTEPIAHPILAENLRKELSLDLQGVVAIYKGSFQYGAVNVFAESLAEAFKGLGLESILIDLTDPANFIESISGAVERGCRFIVSFGGVGALAKDSAGGLIHDSIPVPLLVAFVDHPGHAPDRLSPKLSVAACYDESHLDYLKLRFGSEKKCFHLPHGGCKAESPFNGEYAGRPIDILYPASFLNPDEIMSRIVSLQEPPKRIILAACEEILSVDSVPPHEAAMRAAKSLGADLSCTGRQTFSFVMDQTLPLSELYTRARKRMEALKTLDDAGIPVEICGSGWPCGLFKSHRVSEAKPFSEVLDMMARSKIVLNTVMVPGSHERVVSSTLSGAVVLSDYNKWIAGEFKDGSESVLYRWSRLADLPDIASSLLGDLARAASIAEGGRIKAESAHTWVSRAEHILSCMDSTSDCAQKT